jgi:hypothetical protein
VDLKTKKTQLHAVYKIHFTDKDTYRLKVKGWKRHTMGMETRSEQALLYSSQIKQNLNKKP